MVSVKLESQCAIFKAANFFPSVVFYHLAPMIMQKWDIGFGNFELEFLFKISRKLNLMESQRYLFHVLKGKFPLLSRKARDEECYFFFFFLNI